MRICPWQVTVFGLMTGFVVTPARAQDVPPRVHLGLDAGSSFAVAGSFAVGPASFPILAGIRVGYAYRLPSHSFDEAVYHARHLDAFARYQPTEWLQAELGVTVLASAPEEDSRNRRSFHGVVASVMVGYRFMFIGPVVRVGTMESQFGTFRGMGVRWVIPLGGS